MYVCMNVYTELTHLYNSHVCHRPLLYPTVSVRHQPHKAPRKDKPRILRKCSGRSTFHRASSRVLNTGSLAVREINICTAKWLPRNYSFTQERSPFPPVQSTPSGPVQSTPSGPVQLTAGLDWRDWTGPEGMVDWYLDVITTSVFRLHSASQMMCKVKPWVGVNYSS